MIDYIIMAILLVIELLIFSIMLYLFLHQPKKPEYKIIYYQADTGKGKTSLAVALGICWHINYEPYVRQQFAQEYESLHNNGFPLVEMPTEPLVCSDTTAFLSLDNVGMPLERFGDCDFSKFNIPTDENYKDIDYYPLGTYFIFDEISNKAHCRDWSNFSLDKGVLFDLHRKVGYNINLISPRADATDKILRTSAHIIRNVVGLTFKTDKKGNILSCTWYFVDYSGKTRLDDADKGIMPHGSFHPFTFYVPNRPDIIKWKYTFKGDIFKYYDSYRERLYFYHHLTKFKTTRCKQYISTRQDVLDLVKHHPVMGKKYDRTICEKRKGDSYGKNDKK